MPNGDSNYVSVYILLSSLLSGRIGEVVDEYGYVGLWGADESIELWKILSIIP